MQSSSSAQHQPVTLVISEVIEPDNVEAYEEWARGINEVSIQVEGCLGVDVIRPRDHAYPEYVVIVKFDSYEHLRAWKTSPTYYEWMEKSQGLIETRTYQFQPSGMELWFTLPGHRRRSAEPAYYKKVVMGVISVYPLILLADALIIRPFFSGLPFLVTLFISVTFVSALLTYPVMPWLTQVLNRWLYPLPNRQRRSVRPV